MKRGLISLSLCFVMTGIIEGQTEKLIYHEIRTDRNGHIIPWYNEDPGVSYDHIVRLIWNFWDTMRMDYNGIPYYMNHQVWNESANDSRGLGGDQLQMALSSWRLLYAYTGNERIRENMRFIADYYLSHGLSPANAQWPDLPFPYNTLIYSGIYDGDMVIGKGFTQPDKAGSLGYELLNLYKMTSNERFPNITDDIYLQAAIRIANTLSSKIRAGDENNSPFPFKVNAYTGETGALKSNEGTGKDAGLSSYTSNWSGTMELFLQLREMKLGDTSAYGRAFSILLNWMKEYPLRTNKWGPFFEDVPGWSDTQINAVTFAQFIMQHPEFFPEWKTLVNSIFGWVYQTLGNDKWKKYGVIVVNEQTAYRVPGNSHTSRQASAELQYIMLSGDRSRYENAVRQLNWATYMVDNDGKNRYPQDENWLTDGYGDYVRHYLRAMAAAPELAPGNQDHLISSTSVIQQIQYVGNAPLYIPPDLQKTVRESIVSYRAYNESGEEKIRLRKKPGIVLLNGKKMNEMPISRMGQVNGGYSWLPMNNGGLLLISRLRGNQVLIGN